METTIIGNYSLLMQRGTWKDFDYFEAVHASLGMKVQLLISKSETEPVNLEGLKKLRKLGFESVLKIFELFYHEGRLVVITEYPSQMSLFDYFYTLNRPLDPVKAVDIVTEILEALEELHNLGYAVGFLDESMIFFIQGKKIKIGGNWLVHFENVRVTGEYELAENDAFEARIRDVARCGAILFRFLNQDTLLQTNLNFAAVLQAKPASIPKQLLEIIHKAVNLDSPTYRDASGLIADLKSVRTQLEADAAKKFEAPPEAGRVDSGSRVKVTAILKGSDTIAESTADNLIKEKSARPKMSLVNIFLILLIITFAAGGLLYIFKGSIFGTKSPEPALLEQSRQAATPKLVQSDSLKVLAKETSEIILQSASVERDLLLTRQNQLDSTGKISLEFFTELYNGLVDLKSDKLESAYPKLEKASNKSDKSVKQLDASLALGCYSILKNEGENAWLYLENYAVSLESKLPETANFSADEKTRLELKKNYLSRLRANFK